jgi:hypothetical protein
MTEQTIEKWRQVWRGGFVPNLSTDNLLALEKALDQDDLRLVQGATTIPPPLGCVADWPVEAACALSYMGVMEQGGFTTIRPEGAGTIVRGEEGCTVADAEEFFARKCFACDTSLGEPAGCRWFLQWFDETPRSILLRELLAEVRLALEARKTA